MTTAPINPSHRLFAATVLLKYADAMAAQVQGVRKSNDIEYVHRMRVATRRTRNAMDLFERLLPAKRSKRWLKQIKRITRALGGARDADVQIISIREFLETLDQAFGQAYRPGIERLLLRLTQRRQGLQRTVIAAMDRLESAGTVHEMQEILRAYQAKDRTAGAEAVPASLQDQARATIVRRLEEVMVFSPYVASPDHVDELHRMRIVAKRLRYTLEVYDPLFSNGLKPPIKLMKHVQTMLGEIHDDDVWLHDLPIFLEEEKQRFQDFFGQTRGFPQIAQGVRFLIADRRQHRQAAHTHLAQFWKQATETGQWDWLRAGFAPAQPTINDVTDQTNKETTALYNFRGPRGWPATKRESGDG